MVEIGPSSTAVIATKEKDAERTRNSRAANRICWLVRSFTRLPHSFFKKV
jgi:hypothetical protein